MHDVDIRRAVRRAADDCEAELPDILTSVAETLRREVPILAKVRSSEETQRAGQEALTAFIDIIRRGEPADTAEHQPASLDMARALAQLDEGGLRPLMRFVHLGHREVLARWEEALGRLELPIEVLLGAMQESRRLTFAFIDGFARALFDEYERERGRLVRAGQARREQTIRALLSAPPADQDAASRALGHELGLVHTALVCWTASDDGEARLRLDQAVKDVALTLGASRPLLLTAGPATVWAWIVTAQPPAAESLALLARQHRRDGVSVAVGVPARGADGFRASYHDALKAQQVARVGDRRPGAVTAYADVELAAMAAGDIARARRFVASRLGELATGDDHHARLRATLRVFLDEDGNRQAAADRLGVHANTIGNRVRACQDLIGPAYDDRQVEIDVALTLTALLGSAVLR